jgi:hypothetical protein
MKQRVIATASRIHTGRTFDTMKRAKAHELPPVRMNKQNPRSVAALSGAEGNKRVRVNNV